MTSDIPVPTEADYLDAARANVTALLTSPRDAMTPEDFERTVANYAALPSHRAAVDSAYAAGWRAGYGQGRDDEAASLDTPPPAGPGVYRATFGPFMEAGIVEIPLEAWPDVSAEEQR